MFTDVTVLNGLGADPESTLRKTIADSEAQIAKARSLGVTDQQLSPLLTALNKAKSELAAIEQRKMDAAAVNTQMNQMPGMPGMPGASGAAPVAGGSYALPILGGAALLGIVGLAIYKKRKKRMGLGCVC